MVKPRHDQLYLNVLDRGQLYSLIDERYLRRPGEPQACYEARVGEGTIALELYWGSDDGPDGGLVIGVRGKVIALCSLHALLFHERRNWGGLAEAIASSSRQSTKAGRLPEVRQALDALCKEPTRFRKEQGENALSAEKGTVIGRLVSLIRSGESRTIPPADLANQHLVVVAGFIADAVARSKGHADSGDVFNRIWEVLSGRFPAPSVCAEALVAALDLAGALPLKRGAPVRNGPKLPREPLHSIEPGICRYVEAAGQRLQAESVDHGELHPIVRDIWAKLAFAEPNPTSLLVLTGGAHAGKKAVVGDLVRSLRPDPDGTVCLPLVGFDGDRKRLPVFVINARGYDHIALVREILRFLKRVRRIVSGRNAVTSERADDVPIHEPGLDRLLEEVEELHHDHPAFFVVMDVYGHRNDSLLKVLRNYGIDRLLRTLLKSNPDSRVLVTDPEADENTYKALRGAHETRSITLPPPTIKRLAWYLPEYGNAVADAVDLLDPEAHVVPTSGTALIALATLIREMDARDTLNFRLGEHVSDASKDLDRAAARIYVDLLGRLETQGCLPAIALVSASEDGLTDTTLRWSLDTWPDEVRSQTWIDSSAAEAALERLGRESNWLFVRKEKPLSYDIEEYSFAEGLPRTSWEVSRDVADMILAALRTQPNWLGILRMAHRLIAIAARRRARFKTMRSTSEAGPRRNAEARDIQSYVALLASIDPAQLDGACLKSRSLRLSSDRVFVAGPAFDARLALRFAVQCQLREDIDRDFRLSMVSDQDELRLRLYLLAFCDLGKPHRWTIDSLRQSRDLAGVPKEIQKHLTTTFSTEELLQLLVTVALTAFHCQLGRVVDWAHERSLELEPAQGTSEWWQWWSEMARIRCSVADIAIQTGHDYGAALSKVQLWSAPAPSHFDLDALMAGRPTPSGTDKIAKSWMRLRSREAELLWLTSGNDTVVDAICRQLIDLEHRLASRTDRDDPIVLSGRTARRLIRFLANDAPVFVREPGSDRNASPVREDAGILIRHVLEVNISRLRRFSGADRVGVLVDMARRHHLDGNHESALNYAELALEATFSGSVSHGSKIDVLGVNAGLRLFEAELALQQGDANKLESHLREARECFSLLERLAKSLGFQPALAMSLYLEARHDYTLSQVPESEAARRRHRRSAANLVGRAIKLAQGYGGSRACDPMRYLEALVKPLRSSG